MPNLYIANTNFELELESPIANSLEHTLRAHPICLQLQFLPLLFAGGDDQILVTDLPDLDYLKMLSELGFVVPKLVLYSEKKFSSDLKIIPWGYSKSVESFAKVHKLTYESPPLEIVKNVNSKAWSFRQAPKLFNACLLYSLQDLENLVKNMTHQIVLKSCYGFSGRGHCFISEPKINEKVLSFCQKEWEKQNPLIAEPWLKRILDFSSQWLVTKKGEISLVGATKMLNTPSGQYEGSIIGSAAQLFPENQEWFSEHLVTAQKILKQLRHEGYFGFVGIDAMVCEDPKSQKPFLHPVVEVNARMTMALAMLLMQKKHFPEKLLECRYERGTKGFFPNYLNKINEKTIKFNRQLIVSII